MQAHPFFEGVAWERLPHQRAPYVPRVEHALDTQNFERFDEEAGPAGGSGGKRWARADPNFIGYTYKNWEAVGSPAGARAPAAVRPECADCTAAAPWPVLTALAWTLCERREMPPRLVARGRAAGACALPCCTQRLCFCRSRCAAAVTHPWCWRADKAPGQLQLRRKPASRPSLNSLHGAFAALDVAGDGGRGGVS